MEFEVVWEWVAGDAIGLDDERLFRGRSPDRVRRDQVGTKILPQTGCGLKNRAGPGGGPLSI
jgi:hypothetical protein